MTTYYIDKRLEASGDGLTPETAWNALWKGCDRNYIPNGTHTVEVVAGSGPYTFGDFVDASLSTMFSPRQQSGSFVTWNFNGNTLGGAWEVNDPTYYKWTQSSDNENQYYLTSLTGTKPKYPWDQTTDTDAVYTCIIDDVWNQSSMNLDNNVSGRKHNWRYGDHDTLGFSTLYVQLEDGSDPTNSGFEIFVNEFAKKTIAMVGGFGSFVINDAVITGGADKDVDVNTTTVFNRCHFKWGGLTGLSFGGSTLNGVVKYSKFTDFGHRGVEIEDSPTNPQIFNCLFDGCHLSLKIDTDSAITVTMKNCKTINAYAGCIQHDQVGATLVETNNSWQIDQSSPHDGKAVAFTTGTRQWTTTDATDYPASFDTSNPSYDDQILPNGAGVLISGVHDQASPAEDFNGVDVLFIPNIGAEDGRTSQSITTDDYTPTGYDVRAGSQLIITGGGDIDLSGLTDASGNINVTLKGHIKSYTGKNGVTSYKWGSSGQGVISL